MHLVFDIFQGIGIAAAVGIRPFLPAAVAGVLAAAGVQLHFSHSDFAWLAGVPFLFAVAVLGFLLLSAERTLPASRLERGPLALLIIAASLGIAAVMFAGALARGHYAFWPGFPAGVACALIAILATRPLFERARSRLDSEAALTVPLYAEAGAIVLAALSVVAPPVGPIALALLLWLLFAGRRREGQKYAGLRILR